MKKPLLCFLIFALCSIAVYSQDFYPLEVVKSKKGVQYLQNDQELTYKEFKYILKNDPNSAEQFKKGQVNLISGISLISLSVFPLIGSAFAPEGSKSAFTYAVAGACLTIGGLILAYRGLGMMQKKSVILYNSQAKGVGNETAMLLLGFTSDGVGLTFRF